jgi:uncharacterized repeat protein (TIGR01451 family)
MIAGLLIGLPGTAFAQSACTAMFGLVDNDAGGGNTNYSLRYYNATSNQWVNLGNVNGGASPADGFNALAGSNVTNLLYYVNRTTRQLRSINLNTVPFTDAAIGIITAPPAPAVATNIVGATTDATGRLFVYATDGTNQGFVAQLNPASAALITAWTQLQTTGGVNPAIAGSGDIFCDNSGTCYVLSNTTAPSLHVLNLTPGASFGRTNSPPLIVSGVSGVNVGGVALDPATQSAYFSNGNATSSTYALNLTTGAATLDFSTTTFWLTDMGNCVSPPVAPTLSKTFTPAVRSGATGTSTLLLTIGNANANPIFLDQALQDTFPAGMVVGPIPALTSSCSSAFGTPTAAAGATSMVFASGGRIPANGCSISFTVSATASLTGYTNTIPAGSLSTTAGDAPAAQAVFTVGSDFTLSKFQREGTTDPLQTSTLTVGAAQTLQYVLTIVNTATGGSGSVTFTDTLPALITPVLVANAVQTGGGSCNATAAVVGGRTRFTGSVLNAPAGATCTLTITARGSAAVTVSTTVQNTASIASFGAVNYDLDATDNNATVTTVINPAVLLTITKNNSVSSVTAGQTMSYTITVANLGPSPANNSLLQDPVATGLSCTNVSCSVSAGTAVCPASSMAALQGAGITIATLPSASTLSFIVTCGVTATGL